MSKVKTEKKTKKEPRAKAQKKAYALFRKAPKVPAFLTMIASIGTLALLLLFQMGLLFDWGLTAITSNNVVMAITVTLSVIGFVSVVNVVLAFTTDADNEERVKEFLSTYQGLEGREVKAETDMEVNLNTPNDDTGYEQNLTPVDQEAKEDDYSVNMADALYEDPAEPVAVDDLLNGAEDDVVEPAQETTDSDAQPVDDLEDQRSSRLLQTRYFWGSGGWVRYFDRGGKRSRLLGIQHCVFGPESEIWGHRYLEPRPRFPVAGFHFLPPAVLCVSGFFHAGIFREGS